MAVCVVCLLCAEHLPCKHVDDSTMSTKKLLENDDSRLVNQNYMDINNLADKNSYNNVLGQAVPNKRKGRTKDQDEQSDSDKQPALGNADYRQKRHAIQSNSDDEPDVHRNSQMYIRKLFERFGDVDGDKMTMNVIGFEKMLQVLNLYSLLVDQTPFLSESKASKLPNDDFNDTVSGRFQYNERVPNMPFFELYSSVFQV